MKKLNLMNIKEDDVLNRNEMKSIMAGSGGGNILCNFGGSSEWSCNADANHSPLDDLTWCTDRCVETAQALGTHCEGCAQFP